MFQHDGISGNKQANKAGKKNQRVLQIEQERASAAPPAALPPPDGRQRTGREGVFLRRDSMIAAHDGLISRSRSFAPREPLDSPSAQYAAMEGKQLRLRLRQGNRARVRPGALPSDPSRDSLSAPYVWSATEHRPNMPPDKMLPLTPAQCSQTQLPRLPSLPGQSMDAIASSRA